VGVPRNVSSSMAATRACARPTRLATRDRSWLPSTQLGQAPGEIRVRMTDDIHAGHSKLWHASITRFVASSFSVGPIYNVVQFSYRLSLIPDALQGRVNSVFRLLAFGFQPLGAALTGVLIQTIHAVPTVLALAAVMLALAILTQLNPHVRRAQPIVGASAA